MLSPASLADTNPIPVDCVTLPDVLDRLVGMTSDADVEAYLKQTQDLFLAGFSLPPLDKQPPGVRESTTSWSKRELAVFRLRQGLCDGSLRALVYSNSERFRLEPHDWRTASFIDRIVRGGFIYAGACESIGRHQGLRVLIRTTDFRRWLSAWRAAPAPALRPKQHDCFEWLQAQMLANPERAPKLQKQYFHEARDKFSVSQRLFKSIWKKALKASGAQWRAGRPSKASPRSRSAVVEGIS
jgi:hypothetical protein